jgi:CRISPR/Cas system CSM-associated protein Csm2 small subunit
LILPGLYKETGKKKERFEAAVELLSKLIKNIIENPNEEKFR